MFNQKWILFCQFTLISILKHFDEFFFFMKWCFDIKKTLFIWIICILTIYASHNIRFLIEFYNSNLMHPVWKDINISKRGTTTVEETETESKIDSTMLMIDKTNIFNESVCASERWWWRERESVRVWPWLMSLYAYFVTKSSYRNH